MPDDLALLDLLTPAIQRDPYPFYHRLRTRAPVYWDQPVRAWVLTRYADVAAAFRDPRLSARRFADIAQVPSRMRPLAVVLDRTLLYSDPPTHTRLRALATKAFTPRLLEQMRPRIQALVDGLIDNVSVRGHMDVVQDLATPLPVTVIGTLLGFPASEFAHLKQWADALMPIFGNGRLSAQEAAAAVSALDSFTASLQAEFARRRRQPRDDFLQALIEANEQGETLSDDELVANCLLLLTAGHETTTHAIASAVLALLRHPDQREAWRRNPALSQTAVPELLRFDGPLQLAVRMTMEDVTLGGQDIPAGQRVLLCIGAANHDPEQFADPERLHLGRTDNRHMGFGHGMHYCLGAVLARMEIGLCLERVLERLPDLRLAEHDLAWHKNLSIRGLTHLRVAF